MKKEYLEIGKIVNIHGLGGVVKVLPWCDAPELFCELKTLYRSALHIPMELEHAHVQKGMVLVKLRGIDTAEEAEALRNTILYVRRTDLPLDENTHFIQDLIGMTVKDVDSGEIYGKLRDVLQTGANDVYEIAGKDGKALLVPVIPQVVLKIDTEEDVIWIRPLEGLFDGC